MKRLRGLRPEDRLLFALCAFALLIILALLIYDVRRGEPADGFPQQDQATEVCALRLFKELAQGNGIPLNGEDGHGRAWDELMAACEQDPYRLEWPEKVTMDSVLNGGGDD